jgi:pimeloyl-ACP methyl ester carboxylesterase
MFYRALSGDTVKEFEAIIQHVKEAGLDQQVVMLQQKYQLSTPKEALMKVQKPVLVICGDEDSDNGNAKELAKLFPHSTYVQVPGGSWWRTSNTRVCRCSGVCPVSFLKKYKM